MIGTGEAGLPATEGYLLRAVIGIFLQASTSDNPMAQVLDERGSLASYGRREARDMTDQYTSLSLTALKEIISGVDQTLAIFDRQRKPLAASEENVRTMLRKLRRQLKDQLEHHPENRK